MRSVADSLRQETTERASGKSVEERVALALELGQAGLETYRRAKGLDARQAAAELRRRRQLGRQPSSCMEALVR